MRMYVFQFLPLPQSPDSRGSGVRADHQDPTYQSLYSDLPRYLQSVHTRYPPVCQNCQPAVNDALRKANHRANVDAWGSALRRGNDIPRKGRGNEFWDILLWRLRGVCFGLSAVLSLSIGGCSESTSSLMSGFELMGSYIST
jgi:hypothetical protein